nr:MAG TPA: Churchill protein [Caudoviricetes sp.]
MFIVLDGSFLMNYVCCASRIFYFICRLSLFKNHF